MSFSRIAFILFLGIASCKAQHDLIKSPTQKGGWQFQTLSDWLEACSALPTNRELKGKLPHRSRLPLTAKEFDKALDAAFTCYKKSPLSEKDHWVKEAPSSETFFDTTRLYVEKDSIPFVPFVEKLEVGISTQFILHGDFHGDIHSLNGFLKHLNERNILKGFKIISDKTRFLFLGDYTDRGVYGSEVIYTLIRLKCENPDRVHLVRGNHEDYSLTARYGFLAELAGKFGRRYDFRKPLRLYDFLPVAFYVGCEDNFIQCNHGGMEVGYDPKPLLCAKADHAFQLLGDLRQRHYLDLHPEFLDGLNPFERRQLSNMLRDFRPTSPVSPSLLGFMWNDFTILENEPSLGFNPARAWVYGMGATRHILKNASTQNHRLRAVIRAHQHSSLLDPMMRRLVGCGGVHRHWQAADSKELFNAKPSQLKGILESAQKRNLSDGSVFTLNVSPDSIYGVGCDFTFDTYAELETAEAFSDWTLTIYNIENDLL